MTGHMLGAAGGVEFTICALVLNREGHSADDQLGRARPGLDLDYTPNPGRRRKVDAGALQSASASAGTT